MLICNYVKKLMVFLMDAAAYGAHEGMAVQIRAHKGSTDGEAAMSSELLISYMICAK